MEVNPVGFHSGGDDGIIYRLGSWAYFLGSTLNDGATAVCPHEGAVYVGGNAGDFWSGVMPWQGTPGGGYIIKFTAGGAAVWGIWCGNYIRSITAVGDRVYVGGSAWSTSKVDPWSELFQGTHSGSLEGFVIEIQDNGSTATVKWGQWFGGSSDTSSPMSSAYGDDKLWLGGGTYASGWDDGFTMQGGLGGDLEGFVLSIPVAAPEEAEESIPFMWPHF